MSDEFEITLFPHKTSVVAPILTRGPIWFDAEYRLYKYRVKYSDTDIIIQSSGEIIKLPVNSSDTIGVLKRDITFRLPYFNYIIRDNEYKQIKEEGIEITLYFKQKKIGSYNCAIS